MSLLVFTQALPRGGTDLTSAYLMGRVQTNSEDDSL